jgi:predicted ATP-grasp superfamily ATP-dependent carboligase
MCDVFAQEGNAQEGNTGNGRPRADYGQARDVRANGQRRVGAVVVGGDYNGLGIVRSLGRQGVPVVVVDDEPSVSRFSRFTRETVRVDALRDEDEIVAHLVGAGSRLGLDGWLLFATRDEIVAAISRRRDELAEMFRVPIPEWEVVRWAWDKRLSYERARALGIPTPETRFARTPADLASIAAAHLPIVIKPAIKEHFIYVTKVKAWRADTPDELDDLFRRALAVIPADEIMIQDLVPGGGHRQFSYCAFFKGGKAVTTMTVRRTRQRPADFGRSSTFVETVEVPEIEEYSERFLADIGYYGLVEIEYKLDERDGEYRLLDVNPRTWGYHSLGSVAGADFPLALYRDQIDEPGPASRAASGVRWFRLTTDLAGALSQFGRGELDVGSYLRTLRTADIEAVFQRDDLIPGVAEIALLPYLYKTRAANRWLKVLSRDG